MLSLLFLLLFLLSLSLFVEIILSSLLLMVEIIFPPTERWDCPFRRGSWRFRARSSCSHRAVAVLSAFQLLATVAPVQGAAEASPLAALSTIKEKN